MKLNKSLEKLNKTLREIDISQLIDKANNINIEDLSMLFTLPNCCDLQFTILIIVP